jgi:hypothetical protein
MPKKEVASHATIPSLPALMRNMPKAVNPKQTATSNPLFQRE